MAISKAVRSGRLKRLEGGGIDVEDPLSLEYLKHPSQQRQWQGGKITASRQQQAPRSSARRHNVTQIIAERVTVGAPAESEDEDWQNLSLQERIEKVRKLQLQNAILRGQHIERETVRRWIMHFYSIIASVFRSLSGRIMPELVAAIRSAETDAQAVIAGSRVVDEEVYRGLQHVQTTIVGFGAQVPELASFRDPQDGHWTWTI